MHIDSSIGKMFSLLQSCSCKDYIHFKRHAHEFWYMTYSFHRFIQNRVEFLGLYYAQYWLCSTTNPEGHHVGLVEQVVVATPWIQLQLEVIEAKEDHHVGLVEQAVVETPLIQQQQLLLGKEDHHVELVEQVVVETPSIQQQQLLRQLIPHQRMLLVLVVVRDAEEAVEEAVVGVPLESKSFECFHWIKRCTYVVYIHNAANKVATNKENKVVATVFSI